MAEMKTKDGFYDVFEDLKDRVQSSINDGNDLDDAIKDALDTGLIYDDDVVELGKHYGAIDTSQVLDDIYEELYNDLYREEYEMPKWRFTVTDSDSGQTYESDYEYDTQDEAESAAEDWITDVKYSIECEETSNGWKAHADFNGYQIEFNECETEEEAEEMAENWAEYLEYDTEQE